MARHNFQRSGLWITAISVITGCGVLLLIGLGGLFWMGSQFWKDLEPTVAVEKYGQILSDWKRQGLAGHFPGAVPATATMVKFSSLPRILQGGGWIQLRVALPAAEVEEVYAMATKRAKQYHDGGGLGTLINHEGGLASGDFNTSDVKEEHEFPGDYRVFIFDAKPYETDGSFKWNHGTSEGVAVSRKRNEVVYWAESW